MQSISRAFYKPGVVYFVPGHTRYECCEVWAPEPASTKSSHDAKWRLGDPNLDPDLVSNQPPQLGPNCPPSRILALLVSITANPCLGAARRTPPAFD